MAFRHELNLLKLLARNRSSLQRTSFSVGLYNNVRTFSFDNYDRNLLDKMPHRSDFSDKPILATQIEKEADRICREVISADPNSDLASCLHKFGDITLSPTLVTEVLKRLSNAVYIL